MSEWSDTMEVARWEIRRFVKPKQLLFSLVFTLFAGAVGFFVANLARRSAQRVVEVAVIGGERIGLADGARDGITLVARPASAADSLRAAVGSRALGGLLVVHGADSAELVVARNPVWRSTLQARLAAARQSMKLRESGLEAAQLAAIVAPMRLQVRYHELGRGGGSERIVAIIAGAVVLYGVFTAGAYMFVSVTGEKQARVTEQVMSSISPQSWIDGKMIGVAGIALSSVATFALGGLLFVAGRALARGSWSFPAIGGHPGTMLLVLVFALLGFAFWLAVLGGIAATVDDPNTSTRAPIMFLPAFMSTTAFMILRNPDSTFAQVLGLLPLTSTAVMPTRLVLTDVPAWEVALSLVLLVGSIWLLRRAAARIFAVGMLLYGKEPGWSEIRRWSREA